MIDYSWSIYLFQGGCLAAVEKYSNVWIPLNLPLKQANQVSGRTWLYQIPGYLVDNIIAIIKLFQFYNGYDIITYLV